MRSVQGLVSVAWDESVAGPVDRAEVEGMPRFRGSYLAGTLHPIFCSSSGTETKRGGQIDLEMELSAWPGSVAAFPLSFCLLFQTCVETTGLKLPSPSFRRPRCSFFVGGGGSGGRGEPSDLSGRQSR